MNKIELFENGEIRLDVEIINDDVWLSQKQMCKLFGTTQATISEHIINIFSSGELDEKTSIGISDKSSGGRKPLIYNLDMILAVGYRVNSKQGIAFRRWASNVLKYYMIEGYAVNMRRLDYLNKTVKLIEIANRNPDSITGEQAKGILQTIGKYTKALDLLDDYDHRSLEKIKDFKYYAYPFGVYNDININELKKNGYIMTFGFGPGKEYRKVRRSDDYKIPRLNISNHVSFLKFIIRLNLFR